MAVHSQGRPRMGRAALRTGAVGADPVAGVAPGHGARRAGLLQAERRRWRRARGAAAGLAPPVGQQAAHPAQSGRHPRACQACKPPAAALDVTAVAEHLWRYVRRRHRPVIAVDPGSAVDRGAGSALDRPCSPEQPRRCDGSGGCECCGAESGAGGTSALQVRGPCGTGPKGSRVLYGVRVPAAPECGACVARAPGGHALPDCSAELVYAAGEPDPGY